MPKLVRLAQLLLFFIILVNPGALDVPFAINNSKAAVPTPKDPWINEDMSGTYVGRVYYGDKTGDQYIMMGRATLQILKGGTEFILTNLEMKKVVKGSIKTAVAKDKPNVRAGEIKAENDDKIDIRWKGDRARRSLKLLRALDSKRVFRFCTRDILRDKKCAEEM